MKKLLLFILLSTLAFSQAPNLFSTYLTTGVSSTDTTFTFTASDSSYAGTGTSYYATIYDTWYANASEAYKANKAEILLINSRTGRTFDVERGKYGTTARSFNTSGRRYKIVVGAFSSNLMIAITSADSNKYMTNNGSTASWGTPSVPDSVDVPFFMAMPSNSGSQTTIYAGFGGATGFTTTEASQVATPFGISGRIHSMFVQSKTNTTTSTTNFTLQSGDSSSASLSASGLVVACQPAQKFGSITGQTLIVTPTKVGNIKIVNLSGSGSMTLIGITFIVRVALQTN